MKIPQLVTLFEALISGAEEEIFISAGGFARWKSCPGYDFGGLGEDVRDDKSGKVNAYCPRC